MIPNLVILTNTHLVYCLVPLYFLVSLVGAYLLLG